MLSKIQSLGCRGVSGYAVSVECHVSNGLPGFDIVGLPDAAVKEARERVRSAIKTNGMKFPVSRLTVNLAPADTRKAGTLYDLPVLLGILCATGEIRQPPATAAFFGEVSLAGEIRPVTGALTMALAAEQLGLRELFVPAGNAAEAAFAEGVTVYPVENISQLVHHLRGDKPIAPMPPPAFSAAPHFAVDFAEGKAQENVQRAREVAAAGQVLTVFARTITVVFQHAADKAAEEARFRTIDLLHVSALGVQALRVAIPALVVSLFVSADMVSSMLSAIPEFVTRGLQIAGGFIVVVGYAMVLRMMGVKYLMPFFFLGFLAGGYLDFSLLAFGGVGVIIALIYIQLNPQWRKAEPAASTAPSAPALDQLDD